MVPAGLAGSMKVQVAMMKFGHRHPSKTELQDYAWCRLGRGPLAASVGAHLATCKKCAAEADAMGRSLGFVAQASPIAPSAELTSGILVAARREMQLRQSPLRRLWNPRRALAVCAYAAAALVVAAISAAPVWLGHAERVAGQQAAAQPPAAPGMAAEPWAASDDFRAIASEVEVLANAVRNSFARPQSAAERIRQRAVTALDAEIDAALAALQRNPGCTRATQLVQANLERQAETLRALYAERSL